MRPNTKVSTARNSTTPMFSASTAGRNCIFAIHPNQVCSVPVKSRNNSVMSAKKMTARVSLMVRSINVLYSG